ncbi:MAG: GNAT family N-acetyltransferase [Pseudomonadota bacterium]
MHSDFAHQLCSNLETPRLRLQPLMGSHADADFGPMQDDAIYEWISMNKPRSVELLRAHWTGLESRMSPDGANLWPMWAVTTRDGGALVGCIDADIEDDCMCSNFGYYFFPEFWGRGFATEAVRAAADHLLQQGIHRLVATVTVGNLASGQVLKKAGFSFTRTIPDNDTLRGVLFDDEEYLRTGKTI